jgi:hypothetical protein
MMRFLMVTGLVALSAVATQVAAGAGDAPADGWKFVPLRDEAAPRHSIRTDGGAIGLIIEGNGEPIADGRWVKQVPIPSAPYVNLRARYRASGVEMAARNVLAALVQLDESGKEVALEVAPRRDPPMRRDGAK